MVTKSAGRRSPQSTADKVRPVINPQVARGTGSAFKIPPNSPLAVDFPARLEPLDATTIGSELADLDFASLLGGPLEAAVEAQARAALATVNFINEVGFTGEGSERKLTIVDLSHQVTRENVTEIKEVKTPLLAILPIPSLRIESLDVDFNVRLNSVISTAVSTNLGIDAQVKGGFGPVKFKVTATYQRKTSSNVEEKREYTMGVKLRAVQDEITPGLKQVLDLLTS